MNDPKRTHIPTTNATATTANAIHKTAAATRTTSRMMLSLTPETLDGFLLVGIRRSG